MSKKRGAQPVFEKLGAFYLGRTYDGESGTVAPDLLLYDSKDLTTHAVCVGMTGSGKTGLCIGLLEEAALDGIPALVIDPKGDLGNLMLTFPELRPADFEPWVDAGAATRKGMTAAEYAAKTAATWRQGLADWGQDGARIGRLRAAADFAIYTPGSSAGLGLTVLRSFAAPPPEIAGDADLFRERISTVVSGILALLGVDADPIQSREHILLSNILQHTWQQGGNLDLPALVHQVQAPPFDKIGVVDLESFYPGKDRAALAMRLNSLLASPSFAGWLEGEPLDIGRLLWTEDGRPRVSVLSIAHLSDPERMFFVTLLLNEVIGWMRRQSGTSSLRALLYMDEVLGYLPPTANPPSKLPMLTLLKQARAFGLGVVLATQNPVDLDYKALSNAGTWLLGRLQTERDKMRVLDGLEGASAAAGATFDRKRLETTLSGLKSRVFLLNNVHEDQPVLFQTRWAMSYLRGPLTRTQVQTLMEPRKAAAAGRATGGGRAAAKVSRTVTEQPVVPPSVSQFFQPAEMSAGDGERLVYRPAVIATVDLHYVHARTSVDCWKNLSYVATVGPRAGADIWKKARQLAGGEPELADDPDNGAEFARLPSPASRAKSYTTWEKSLKTHLYQNKSLNLQSCKAVKLTSRPEETQAEFRVRVREAVREQRDAGVEKLRKRYTPKLTRLQDRIRTAEQRLGREQSQYSQQKMQTAISLGATVLGALFGRTAASVGTVGRATTTMRGMGRASREKGDITRAQRSIKDLQQKLADLEVEFEDEVQELKDRADPDSLEIKEVAVRPRKSDINIGRLALLWRPWRVGDGGIAEPAFAEDEA